MKVIVVGASGNVGSAVLRALVDDTAVREIVAVARRTVAFGPPKVRWWRADISQAALAPIVRGADAVIHLAWRLQPQHRRDVLAETNLAGTRRLIEAVGEERVPSLIVASSVGAYAAGPKDLPVDEAWPTSGIPSSTYSRHKAEVERMLSLAEKDHPELRVVRMRTSLVFQRAAASEIARIFVGPWTPRQIPHALRFVPRLAGLRVQATHADDIGEAYRLVLHSDASGAFNVAAPGVVDADVVAELVGGRAFPMPTVAARAVMGAGFAFRVQRSEPGWLDLALATPLMDSGRADTVLGWKPRRTGAEALHDLLAGLGEGAGISTRPLHPRRGGRLIEPPI